MRRLIVSSNSTVDGFVAGPESSQRGQVTPGMIDDQFHDVSTTWN